VITKQLGIAIAAPGGATTDNLAVERGLARLRDQGVLVHNYYDHAQAHQRFGGTDAGRLAQIAAAVADPDVQVIMALRGQYGMTRILPHIDFKALADSGKIFVGYSDVTALHMGLMAATGAISYAGPMVCDDISREEWDEYTHQQFWQCLTGPVHTIRSEAQGNPLVEVEGPIWGGNLAMMVSLLGTPYFPRINAGILYFEDVAEHPYRVERMLLQLMQAGVLQRQQAIVLGDFSRYRLSPADNGYDFDAMLAYLRAMLPVPILTGLPFGHIVRRCTIPFGASAQLKSDEEGFTLSMADYPTVRMA
jgi:muramoyltetrapeptide carboxypeptidase